MSEPNMQLTDRQRREIEFHRDFARQWADAARQPVSFEIINSSNRRWWNAYWSAYTRLLAHNWRPNKKALVIGCGFGDDVARIAECGAETYGFDLSAEVIAVTRERFARFGYKGNLDVMPSEAMLYDDAMFDLVFIVDILHHANIPATAAEIKRVLKPGGRVIGDELYTHSVLQRLVRQSLPVRAAYKHLVPWIYGTDTPYITADEHKIDEAEFASFASIFVSLEIDYFDFCAGRLFPGRFATPTKLDRIALRAFSGGGRFLAGRVVFEGVV